MLCFSRTEIHDDEVDRALLRPSNYFPIGDNSNNTSTTVINIEQEVLMSDGRRRVHVRASRRWTQANWVTPGPTVGLTPTHSTLDSSQASTLY